MASTQGLYFPVFLKNGKPIEPTLVDSIDASLRNLLNWAIDSRYFNKDFGSILPLLLGAPISPSQVEGIKVYLRASIAKWETRIEVKNIEVIVDPEDSSKVSVWIEASIKETNEDYSIKL